MLQKVICILFTAAITTIISCGGLPAPVTCQPGYGAFYYIRSKGTCGALEINTETECREAAQFSGVRHIPFTGVSTGYPGGCTTYKGAYRFQNSTTVLCGKKGKETYDCRKRKEPCKRRMGGSHGRKCKKTICKSRSIQYNCVCSKLICTICKLHD